MNSRSESPLGRGRTLSSLPENLKSTSPLRNKSITNLTWKGRAPSTSPLRSERIKSDALASTHSRQQDRLPILQEQSTLKPNKENLPSIVGSKGIDTPDKSEVLENSKATKSTSPPVSRTSINRVFQKFDVEGSGKISINGLLDIIKEIETESTISFNEANRDFIRNVAVENPDLYLDENDVYSLIKKTFKTPMTSDKAYTASAKRNILVTTIQTPLLNPSLTASSTITATNSNASRSDDNLKRATQMETEFRQRKKEYEETIVEMEVRIGDLVKKNDFLEHEISAIKRQLLEQSVKEKSYHNEIQKLEEDRLHSERERFDVQNNNKQLLQDMDLIMKRLKELEKDNEKLRQQLAENEGSLSKIKMEINIVTEERDKAEQEVISMNRVKHENSALEQQIARLNDELHEVKELAIHHADEESLSRQSLGNELSHLDEPDLRLNKLIMLLSTEREQIMTLKARFEEASKQPGADGPIFEELQFSRELIEDRIISIEEMYHAVSDILYPSTDSDRHTLEQRSNSLLEAENLRLALNETQSQLASLQSSYALLKDELDCLRSERKNETEDSVKENTSYVLNTPKSSKTRVSLAPEAHEYLKREIEALRAALSSAHHQLESITTSLHQKLTLKDQELANSVACQATLNSKIGELQLEISDAICSEQTAKQEFFNIQRRNADLERMYTIELNKSTELQLQSEQLQSLFKDKEGELLDQLLSYQSQVSSLQEELQTYQTAQSVVLSSDTVSPILDPKHVATRDFFTQTDPLSTLFETETAEILKDIESVFSDAYNKEICQFRQLIEQYEAEHTMTQNPTNPTDYQTESESEPVEIFNKNRTYFRFNVGRLFVISIVIVILLIVFQACYEIWCFDTFADSIIPQ